VGPVDSVQLVNITPITMIYGTYNCIHGGYKSIYDVWGPHMADGPRPRRALEASENWTKYPARSAGECSAASTRASAREFVLGVLGSSREF